MTNDSRSEDVESQLGISIDMQEIQGMLDELRSVAGEFHDRWKDKSPYADVLWQVVGFLQAVVASGEHGLPLRWHVELVQPNHTDDSAPS